MIGSNPVLTQTETRTSSGPVREFSKGDAVNLRFHEIVPGAGHTYSKGDDQFPPMLPEDHFACSRCVLLGSRRQSLSRLGHGQSRDRSGP